MSYLDLNLALNAQHRKSEEVAARVRLDQARVEVEKAIEAFAKAAGMCYTKSASGTLTQLFWSE